MHEISLDDLSNHFAILAESLPFTLTDQQHACLIKYVSFIHKWNKAYNLTSVRDPHEMLSKHIVDSLQVKPLLKGKSFIDVGTGPGLPGIPLAIAMPDCSFTLLDSLGKRVRFMKQFIFETNLSNVKPIQSRVEDYSPDTLFDGVISRAFASLDDMLMWCQHLVAPTGSFYALKGQYPKKELEQITIPMDYEVMNISSEQAVEGERHLVVLRKK